MYSNYNTITPENNFKIYSFLTIIIFFKVLGTGDRNQPDRQNQ